MRSDGVVRAVVIAALASSAGALTTHVLKSRASERRDEAILRAFASCVKGLEDASVVSAQMRAREDEMRARMRRGERVPLAPVPERPAEPALRSGREVGGVLMMAFGEQTASERVDELALANGWKR